MYNIKINVLLFVCLVFLINFGGTTIDSTHYTYKSIVSMPMDSLLSTTIDSLQRVEDFYKIVTEDPRDFMIWLYDHYYILDKDIWESIYYEEFLYYIKKNYEK